MRKRVFRSFFAWNYEKEEAWLNNMSEKGWQLVHPGFMTYVFEEDHTKRYFYRLELLNQLPSHSESQNYISFLEEMGIQHVGSVIRWGYFRKNASEGPFQIFSDLTSKIEHMKRLRLIIFAVTPINVINLMNMLRGLDERQGPFLMLPFILVLTMVILLLFGLYRVQSMIGKMEKERRLRE